MSNFVETLKSILERNKLSFQSLSKKVGISSSQLSDYASGNYEPSLKNAIILCNFFSCSMDYLFGLDNVQNSFGAFRKENVELFYPRFNRLLELNKTNINKVSKNTYINRNCIYHWKETKIFPKVSILSKLAKELNTSIEYLIGRTDIMGVLW